MPARPYRLDTGFTTPYIPALDTRQEGQKPDTWEDLRDIVTLPFNIRRGADAFSRNRAAFHAAFELENDVVNIYDLMTRPTRSPDPDFDIVPRLKQDGLWDNFRDNFIGVFNEADYNDTFARIQREERNKQIAAAAGPVGTLAMVLAGIVSPTVLLPFTGQSRGAIAIGKAIGWGFAGGLLQELPLQLAQETRTFEESALSVATSTVLGGVLGGAVVFADKALTKIADELDGRIIPGVSRPSVSAASGGAEGVVRDARLRTGALGAEKVVGDQGPVGNFLGSPVVQNLEMSSPLVRFRTAQLSDAGLDVEGVPRGGTVENRVKVYEGQLAMSIKKLDEAYANYFFDRANSGFMRQLGANVQSLVARGDKLTKREFAEQVAIAMENGDQHAIPQVAEVAQFARKNLIDPVFEKAAEAKLFKRLELNEKGEVEVKGDLTYLTRDYNVEAIGRRPDRFVAILQKHIEDTLQADFQAALEKVVKKQAKDKQLLTDMKRPFEEIEKLLAGFRKELKQMDEGRLGADAELDDLVANLRSRSRDKALTPEQRAAAKEELKQIENSDDPFFQERREKRKELRKRITNLNRAAAMWAKKQDGKLERINRLEELQFNSIDRAIRKGQKFFAKLEGMSDDEFDTQLSELLDQFEGLGKQFDRLEERIGEVAKDSDFIIEDEVAAGDALAKAEFKQMGVAARMNRVAERIEQVDSTDREAVRLLLREEYDAMVAHAARLNARRAARAQRLREQAGALDPKIVEERIAELESTIPDRAASFRERWRERGAEGDIPLAPGVKAQFGSEAERLAREIMERIMGTNVRLTGFDVLYEARGPMLARMLDIPAEKLRDTDGVSFLERDVEKLWTKYIRTLAPDIEVTKAFGELDVESGRPIAFTEINEEEFNRAKALGEEMDAAFAKKHPNPTDAQQAKYQEQRDKAMSKLHEEYNLGRKNLMAMLDRIRHTWGVPKDPAGFAARAARTIMNLNVLRFMGGTAVASIPDIAQPIMRYGAGRVFRDGYLPMISNFRALRATHRELQLAGASLDIILHSRAYQMWDVGDYMVRGSKFEKAIEWSSNKMGLLALFDVWTVAMKQVAGATAIAQTLDDIAIIAQGGAVSGATQRLARHGISGDMAMTIWNELQRAGGGEKIDGIWWPNTDAWQNAEAVMAFRAALVGQVNSTIITPGVERPLWSDANLGLRMISQFKSFAFSSTTKTLMAGLQKRDMAVVTGVMVSLALGALSYYIYAMTAGGAVQAKMEAALDDLNGEGWKVFADEAMARSGVFGALGLMQGALSEIPLSAPYVTFAGQRTSRRGGESVVESTLGPSFDMLTTAANVVAGMDDPTQSTVRQASNLLPLQNHFLLRQAFDKIAEATGLPEKRQ